MDKDSFEDSWGISKPAWSLAYNGVLTRMREHGGRFMERPVFCPVTLYPTKGTFESENYHLGSFPAFSAAQIVELTSTLGKNLACIGVDVPFCFHLQDGLYVSRSGSMPCLVLLEKTDRTVPLYLGGRAEAIELQDDPRGICRYSKAQVAFGPDRLASHAAALDVSSLCSLVGQLGRHELLLLNVSTLPTILQRELTGDEKKRILAMSYEVLVDRIKNVASSLNAERMSELSEDVIVAWLLANAITAINYLIAWYRRVSGEYYLASMSRADVYNVAYAEMAEGSWAGFSLAFVPPSALSLSVPDISAEAHDELWTALEAGQNPDATDEILASARRHLFGEEYRLAVIEGCSAVEVLLDRTLRDLLLAQGKASVEIDSLLEADSNWRTSERFKMLKSLTGHDVLASPMYTRWVQLRDVRDDALHTDQRDVSPRQAHDGLGVVQAMLGLVRQAAGQ